MKQSFLYNTKAEILKCRNTSAIWLTLLAAAFLPAINCLILLGRPDVFVPKLKIDPWLIFLRMNWKNGASIILPLYVILLNNAIVQIEYRNNTWKQVYALPRRYTDIFFSKWVVVLGFLAAFFIFFNSCMIGAGLVTGWINNGYVFSSRPLPYKTMLILSGRIGWGILGVTALQFWLSLRFRNYIVPIAVGIGLLVTGLVLMDWDKIIYYPYVHSLFLFMAGAPGHPATLQSMMINAGLAFILLLLAGCRDIYMLKEKG